MIYRTARVLDRSDITIAPPARQWTATTNLGPKPTRPVPTRIRWSDAAASTVGDDIEKSEDEVDDGNENEADEVEIGGGGDYDDENVEIGGG